MKASELISQLQRMINEHGDLKVCLPVRDGFEHHEIERVQKENYDHRHVMLVIDEGE